MNHNGITEVVQKQIADKVSYFEEKFSDLDCFILRSHHGDFTHATKFFFSEKHADRTPNKPGFFSFFNTKLLTEESLFPEDEYKYRDLFNYKKNINALENIFREVEKGLSTLNEKMDIRKVIIKEKPDLSGYDLDMEICRRHSNRHDNR